MNKITQGLLFSLCGFILSTDNTLLKTRSIAGLKLKGVKSIGEDLSRINFAKVNFDKAIFLDTNLTGSDFTDATITGANFFGSILIDTKFNGANFTDVQNLHHAIYKKCHAFPLDLLFWWEYNKNNLSVQQIAQLLSTGFTICQTSYSEDELELINNFKKR